MSLEIEAKFLSIDKNSCRTKLSSLGYTCLKPEFLMKREVFMLTELAPSIHKWARVRDEGDKVTMTFKQVSNTQNINGTEEVELTVDSFEKATSFMRAIGFKHSAYQESLREIWVSGQIEVCLDEWPALPPFIEIEGPNETSVKKASEDLGFDFSKAVFGGIGGLYILQTQYSGEDIQNIKELTFAHAKAGTLTVSYGERE